MTKLQAHCTQVGYDINGKKTIYRITYENGYYKDMNPSTLREAIKSGELEVDNITVGKNNQIYMKQNPRDMYGWG